MDKFVIKTIHRVITILTAAQLVWLSMVRPWWTDYEIVETRLTVDGLTGEYGELPGYLVWRYLVGFVRGNPIAFHEVLTVRVLGREVLHAIRCKTGLRMLQPA